MSWVSNVLSHPIFLVGVGGAIGSNVRFGVGYWLGPMANPFQIPLSTTIVNVLGSFVLGCVAASVSDRTQWVYLLMGVGFCGGFTTFSTFSLELVEQLQQGRVGAAILVSAFNVALGIGALYAGLWICKS